MARKIQVEIVGDASSLERAFGKAGRSSSKLGKAVGSLGKVGIPVLGGAIAAFGLAVKNGFDELSEAQSVTAQTNAALRSTGKSANVTRKQITGLAESLSRMSGVDDEAIQSGQNLLLTFTKIQNKAGKGNKIFDEATKIMLDMSVALGQDMKSSAIQVGKALNDPIRGVTALRRVGVSFTQAQQDQIRTLVESGRTLDAQKLILKELNVEFGKSAKAAGGTFRGQLAKLQNAFDELTGALAKGMLPIVRKVARELTEKFADPNFMRRVEEFGRLLATKVVDGFKAIGEWFQRHWGSIKEGFRTAADLARGIGKAVQFTADVFRKVAPVMADVIRIALVKPLQFVLQLLSGIIHVFSKLPFVGGKFKGALDFVNEFREEVVKAEKALAAASAKKPAQGAGTPRDAKGAVRPRALGGPVMAGKSYRVGERGAETFVPSTNGTIIPHGGGGGGISIAVANFYGVQDVRQLREELERFSKHSSGQTRGRYAGQFT